MVVHFTRSESGGGTGVLKELLNPLVEEVLTKSSLVLNISPVDVYKSWINQMESDTGEKSLVNVHVQCMYPLLYTPLVYVHVRVQCMYPLLYTPLGSIYLS